MLLTCRCKERFVPIFKTLQHIYRDRSILHFAILVLTEVQNLIDQTQQNIHIALNKQQQPMLITGKVFICK